MPERWQAAHFGGPEVLERRTFKPLRAEAGMVRVAVRACGVNPADFKHIGPGQPDELLPLTLGFEAAGTVTEIVVGSHPIPEFHLGDAVVVGLITGGYATEILVPAQDVFPKPENLTFEEAANVLLVGTTAADLLQTTRVGASDAVLVHGASGGVGISTVQQAVTLGATVIGTCGPDNEALVRRFGAIPVLHGEGLLERVQNASPAGIDVALDTVGTDEAADVSLSVVADRTRIATTAGFQRAAHDGFTAVGAANKASGPFRAAVREHVLGLAASGRLRVPLGRTFSFTEAPAALELLMSHHPGGKLALTVHPS